MIKVRLIIIFVLSLGLGGLFVPGSGYAEKKSQSVIDQALDHFEQEIIVEKPKRRKANGPVLGTVKDPESAAIPAPSTLTPPIEVKTEVTPAVEEVSAVISEDAAGQDVPGEDVAQGETEAATSAVPLEPAASPELMTIPEPVVAQTPPPEPKLEPEPEPAPVVQINNTLDVLEANDMDIMDVFNLIVQKSGLKIVAGKKIKARITVSLKNVDVHDALRVILEPNGLAYVEENGGVRVMTFSEFETLSGHKFDEQIKTSIIPLTYAHASDMISVLTPVKSEAGKVIVDDSSGALILIDAPEKVAAMAALVKEMDAPVTTEVFALDYANTEGLTNRVSEILTDNLGKIELDAGAGKLSVTDTEEKIKEIARVIKAFNEKSPEVLIEARIVQIVLSDEHKAGVDWEAIVSDYHSLDLTAPGTADKNTRVSVGTVSNDDYGVLVEALETVGKMSVLSRPRLTVSSNKEAKIVAGEAAGSTSAATAENAGLIDGVVDLFVTPAIADDGTLSIKIHPANVSTPDSLDPASEATVKVKDKVTIVIGGIIKEVQVDSVKKVPLLGDLPIFGQAFRSTDKKMRKTETVIFLTPSIISGGEHPPVNAVSSANP